MSRTFLPHVITDDSALGGNVIEKSLRFNNYSSSADDAQLYRTVSTTSNRRTYTHSFWVRRTKLGYGMIFGQTDGSGNDFCNFVFNSDNKIEFNEYIYNSGGNKFRLITTRVFRDTTAWYHIVTNVDTTQGTAADRVKIYVNGVQETAFDTGIYPDQNYDTFINHTLYAAMRIGLNGWGYGGANCYLAEFNAVDGYAYDPSYFGYTEFQTGIWRPKRYEGVHGTNGYHLKFNDTSNLPLSLGRDASINGNHFQTDNISTSSGTGYDSFPSSPSNTFPTFHNLFSLNQQGGTVTYTEGNLKIETSAAVANYRRYPFAMSSPYFAVNSGKWYVEFLNASSACAFGVTNIGQLDYTVSNNPYGASASTSFIYTNSGEIRRDDSNLTSQASYGDGDVIGVALDLDNMKLYFHKNGTYINSANPNTGTNGYDLNSLPVTPTNTGGFIFQAGSNGVSNITAHVNFGQRAFSHSIPTGFKILNLQNLPKPNAPIIRPQRHFDTVLYTGNSSTQKITGLEFKPDMIWFKSRTSTNGHGIVDSVRGRSKIFYPDTNQDEDTSSSNRDLASFDDGGFTLGNPENLGSTNSNGLSIVAWCWKAGGASVTNTDGTIDTQVSVNKEAGFSILTYTGNGSTTATIGHGLGKTPAWILLKNRSSDSTDWVVMHQSIPSYDGGNYRHEPIKLNSTDAKTSILGIWQTPNSSTQQISDGQTSSGNRPLTNASGDNYVAYCWSEVPGFSKFGVYYGDNNSDGPYVYLGFRPAWVMIKNIEAGSQEWYILDSKRDPDNPVGQYLSASSNAAEATYVFYDFLSDGFKLRNTGAAQNPDNQRIIYMAFAEQPGPTPFETITNAR